MNSLDMCDPVDKELEAMERELHKQLQRYREAAPAASLVAHSATPYAPRGLAVGATQPGELVVEATRNARPDTDQREEEAAELSELRSLAARMDEIFPDADVKEASPAEKPHAWQQRLLPSQEREANRAAAPTDPDTAELLLALEHFDIRLGALQSKEALHLRAVPQPGLSAEAGRAVAELKAQNEHLRACLAAGGKGPLNLDRSLFPGCDKPSTAGDPALTAALVEGKEAA